MDVMKLVQGHKDYIVGMRRHFHQYPELSWEETETTNRIAEELDKMGIPYSRFPETGLVATIKGSGDYPIIGLRADIDALPVTEVKDLAFKSKHEGKMHACGHDSHMAMLLGAARVLAENKEKLKGTVKLIFQPAEEVIQGAKTLLDNRDVMSCDNIMAIHIFPYLPVGTISVEAGPRFTSADTIRIKVIGKGGHGSMPHDAVDPIVAASALVGNLQSITSREIDPRETCVVSICTFNAGTLSNIIPGEVQLSGTTRAFNPAVRDRFPEIIERITKNTCEAYRTEYEFEYFFGTPATINEATSSARAEGSVKKILGEAGLVKYAATPGGEDFAWLLEKMPGYLAFVGARNEANDQCYPLHHERFDIDEEAILNGAALFVQYVLDTQEELGSVHSS